MLKFIFLSSTIENKPCIVISLRIFRIKKKSAFYHIRLLLKKNHLKVLKVCFIYFFYMMMTKTKT